MRIVKCSNCGNEFETNSPTAKYCSHNCREKARIARNRIDMVCPACGKHFMGSTDHGARFCSVSCASKYVSVTKTLTCIDCGCSFEFHGRTRKLRCDACWRKHRSKQAMLYRARKDATVLLGVGSGHAQSVYSNDPVDADNDRLKQRREAYARNKACGLSVGAYVYRSSVITGNDSCALCGYNSKQSALVVHHKNMNRGDNKKENLVILCANCHAVVHQAIRQIRKRGTADPETLWTRALEELPSVK